MCLGYKTENQHNFLLLICCFKCFVYGHMFIFSISNCGEKESTRFIGLGVQ
jgi:hypothetical protein